MKDVVTDRKIVVGLVDALALVIALVVRRLMPPADADLVLQIWAAFQPPLLALLMRWMHLDAAEATVRAVRGLPAVGRDRH